MAARSQAVSFAGQRPRVSDSIDLAEPQRNGNSGRHLDPVREHKASYQTYTHTEGTGIRSVWASWKRFKW